MLLVLWVSAKYLYFEYSKLVDTDTAGKYKPFIEIVKYTVPYLKSRTIAGVLMGVGHVSFVILFVLNVLRKGKRRQGPTLLDVRRVSVEPAREAAPAAS